MTTIVAIDGPGASGKSTTARAVADRLGFVHLDTGAMYRAATLDCLEQGLLPEASPELAQLLESLAIDLRQAPGGHQLVLLSGRDVTAAIRAPQVSQQVSAYSALPMVRERLFGLQRLIGSQYDVVCEGRDIGTRVFPNARFKFFLEADLDVRAQRRYEELQSRGFTQTRDSVREEIRVRDLQDSTREHSPLKKAQDAVLVDTSNMTIPAQVEFVINHIKSSLESD
ncbi:MAG: (d)CMP kinase [Candidatus Neomarinimicrobiota bacterium]